MLELPRIVEEREDQILPVILKWLARDVDDCTKVDMIPSVPISTKVLRRRILT
jgi:hypothetical protein